MKGHPQGECPYPTFPNMSPVSYHGDQDHSTGTEHRQNDLKVFFSYADPQAGSFLCNVYGFFTGFAREKTIYITMKRRRRNPALLTKGSFFCYDSFIKGKIKGFDLSYYRISSGKYSRTGGILMASTSSDVKGSTKRLSTPLRVITAITLVLLAAQFLVGIVVNLYVVVPNSHPGAYPSNYFVGV